jgi:hypothetical protein
MRGNSNNLMKVYAQSLDYERADGAVYYDRQRERLQRRSDAAGLPLATVVAAFAALSPNNAESTNYRALDTCLGILSGSLPKDSPVIAYPPNRIKAMAILKGAPIDETLRGRKVYAFYRNTMNPEDGEWVTVDGHMLGAWTGVRLILRREAEIKSSEYPHIAEDFRSAASCHNLSAPRFQATVWLAWKRIHRILWTPPQLSFWSPELEYARPRGFRERDGQSTLRATSSTQAVQRHLEFPEEPGFTGLSSSGSLEGS